jgi:hypothetical protein
MANVVAATSPPQVYPPTFGRNGTGGVTLPGAMVGESVIAVLNIATQASAASSFEATISKGGQVQQTSGSNLSTSEFYFILLHR